MKRLSLALTIIAIISLMVFMNLLTVKPLLWGRGVDGNYPVLCNCYPIGVGTYTNTTIDISINYYLPKNFTQIKSFTYSLDENANSTLSYTVEEVADIFSPSITDPSKYNHYKIYGKIENLTNNNHALRTFAHLQNGTVKPLWNQTFRVNTNFKEPQLIILSPQNQLIYNGDVPVVINTNSKLLWAYYSLDHVSGERETWLPFSGNMTLRGLSEGYHTLKVSVKTEANEQSTQASSTQTVFFNIGSNQTTLLIILIVIVSAVIAGLAVLLFKRKKLIMLSSKENLRADVCQTVYFPSLR